MLGRPAATSAEAIAPRTPVLVGVAMQRDDDPTHALEPIDLMLKAVHVAGEDSGVPALLTELGRSRGMIFKHLE